MTEARTILICRCSYYHRAPEAVCERVADGLSKAGMAFESVDDLCGAAARNLEAMQRWAESPALCVIACYPRAVRWLFHRAGAALDEKRVHVFNAMSENADGIVAALTADASKGNGEHVHEAAQDAWVPWYPVIDYDRCINCKQCLNFCLFGVYGVSGEGRVEVLKPEGCKTNCPACARVCPERAIIFPKYEKGPINGDEVDDSALDEEKERSELEALLGGDVQEIIRQRTARKRFARREDGGDEMSSDRKRQRLARLQEELDIPQDVLDSLSGPGRREDSGAGDCPNAEWCEGECGRGRDKS